MSPKLSAAASTNSLRKRSSLLGGTITPRETTAHAAAVRSPVGHHATVDAVPLGFNQSSQLRTYLALTGIFLAWKLVLLAVVLTTPADGSGYDTSADLFFQLRNSSHSVIGSSVLASSQALDQSRAVSRTFTKLTRWDAFYFVSAAWKGYVHEQDWAFSFGYTAIVKWLSQVLRINNDDATNVVLHGVLTTNICHLLSTFTLLQLASLLLPLQHAYVAALLHIISPAGVFLVAPYSEAPFALVNFLAQYLYAKAILVRSKGNTRTISNGYTIASGLLFGLATMIRSNGLLNGAMFACDALLVLGSAAFSWESISWTDVKLLPSLWSTILAGMLVGAGYLFPQVVAYREFCMTVGSSILAPSWCRAMPPSIYTYIQSRYWNVGFLRYWTISNIPLFLLAAPMLFVLLYTGRRTLQQSHIASKLGFAESPFILFRLALPQILIALLTLTTAHVQIVNRLSTGYSVWYMCLATAIISGNKRDQKWSKVAVRLMVIYAIVQAALFSAFLPPA